MEAKRYLLDTNILSDLVRNPSGRVAEQVRRVGEEVVCTSVVVAAEMRFGVLKRGSKRLGTQVDAVLGALEILSLEPPCEHRYAAIRHALERVGRPIGGNDLLIAAQALELGLTLVTHNGDEFRRIPGLKVEDWLE
jgi:tRNA(fMet)-specific endonuclease VapC